MAFCDIDNKNCININIVNPSLKCISVSAKNPHPDCISVSAGCREDEYCDVPTPEIEIIDNGSGNEAVRADRTINGITYKDVLSVYEGVACKVYVRNHQDIIDAGYTYTYSMGGDIISSLDDKGIITWTPKSDGGGWTTISKTLSFTFYRDDKCWSNRKVIVYLKYANIFDIVYTDNTAERIINFNKTTIESLFDDRGDIKEITIQRLYNSVTNMSYFMYKCSNCVSLTINTSLKNIINMGYAWSLCSSLTSFPFIDTSNVTNLRYTWVTCSSLTSFPHIDTSNVTDMVATWSLCTSLPIGYCGSCNGFNYKFCHYLFDDGVQVPSGDGKSIDC